MAELSKTAKASVVKAKKEVVVETTEVAIRKLRNDRVSHLFVIDMERVDKLLAAYDAAIAEIATLKKEQEVVYSKAVMATIPAVAEDPHPFEPEEIGND